jgi:CHAT domain-containing protein
MRCACIVVLAVSVQACYAQTNSSRESLLATANQQRANARQSLRQQSALSLEYGMFALRPIPDLPAPEFIDPLQQEDGKRFEALCSEFNASERAKLTPPDPKDPQFAAKYSALLQSFAKNQTAEFLKFFQDRVDTAAGKYGLTDTRYVATLEDAGIALAARDPRSASSFLDRAIKLREREGSGSSDYWKDLQRRCTGDLAHAMKSTSVCESAFQVRSVQPGVSATELAARAQYLAGLTEMSGNKQKSLDYWQKAGEFYLKAGASPLFIAGRFRTLTMSALGGDSEQIVRLNDVTNRYLALGDANARKAVVSSETLKALEEDRHAVVSEPSKVASAVLTGDQILDSYVQAERALKSGRVVEPLPLDWLAAREATANLADPAGACARTAAAASAGASEGKIILMKSQTYMEEKLASATAEGFAAISKVIYACDSLGAHPDSQSSPQVRGYAAMAQWKGQFSELIAPRKLSVLSDQSGERKASLEAADDAMRRARAIQAEFQKQILPQLQQFRHEFENLSPELKNLLKHIDDDLPPGAQKKALDDYVAKHPGALSSQAHEVLGKKYQFYEDASARTAQQRGATDILFDANSQSAGGNPLGFLDLLKPGEAFVDLYKYRPREEDHFGDPRYVAVVSQNGASSRIIQLGPASQLETAIGSFYEDLRGGSDVRPRWTSLQTLLIQPILKELPKGTLRVWLSPDSSLALVPFASLMVEIGSPILISIVPSAYDFSRLRPVPAVVAERRTLLVGALDYGKAGEFSQLDSAEELRGVAALSNQARLKTVTFTGSQASRTAIINQIRGSEFVHLATHGSWKTSSTVTEAFRSARVALSSANSESPDSRLTAEDIIHLDLSGVKLVTLSACTSGQGTATDGQGLTGFQTAFAAAGARALLLSLWKVPDAPTTELMQEFYRGIWQSGLSKAEALRQAQIKIRANPSYADPINWAAWVLLGDAW